MRKARETHSLSLFICVKGKKRKSSVRPCFCTMRGEMKIRESRRRRGKRVERKEKGKARSIEPTIPPPITPSSLFVVSSLLFLPLPFLPFSPPPITGLSQALRFTRRGSSRTSILRQVGSHRGPNGISVQSGRRRYQDPTPGGPPNAVQSPMLLPKMSHGGRRRHRKTQIHEGHSGLH